MSRRVQRRTKEDVPTEEKEDSGSDSSTFDKGYVAEALRRMDENLARRFEESRKQNEENRRRDDEKNEVFKNGLTEMFQDMLQQAFGNAQQANEGRFQHESNKLETMMEVQPVKFASSSGLGYGLGDVCQNDLKKADQFSDGARSRQELESAPLRVKEVLEKNENPFLPSDGVQRQASIEAVSHIGLDASGSGRSFEEREGSLDARHNQHRQVETAPVHVKEVLGKDKNSLLPSRVRHGSESKLVSDDLISVSTESKLVSDDLISVSTESKLVSDDLVFVSPTMDVSGNTSGCRQHTDDMAPVEHMLRNQHVYEIGGLVRSKKFNYCTRFRDQTFFLSQCQPGFICYVLRQASGYAPQGVLSIEEHISKVFMTVLSHAFPRSYFVQLFGEGGVLNLLSGRLKGHIGLSQEMMELFVICRDPDGLFFRGGMFLSSVIDYSDEPREDYCCTGKANEVDFLNADMLGIWRRVKKKSFEGFRLSLDHRSYALLSDVMSFLISQLPQQPVATAASIGV